MEQSQSLIKSQGNGTGSVREFYDFTIERKQRFLELAEQYWPNLSAICKAVGVSRWTVGNHRKSDPDFNNSLHEIDQRICDEHERVLVERGMDHKGGFLDRISYLRAHRPELYDRAKVVKIEGYKMAGPERTQRLGAVEAAVDATIVQAYTTRKERNEQRRLKAAEKREATSGGGQGG